MSQLNKQLNSKLWQPTASQIEQTSLTQFIHFLQTHKPLPIKDYDSLYQWSIQEPEKFWSLWWDYADVIGDKGEITLQKNERMIDARWFVDSRLNFAENLLESTFIKNKPPVEPVIIFSGEDQIHREVNYQTLKQQVASVSAYLRETNIDTGDVVAGYLPNMPEAIICMLATASIGAIWTSCSPDFGVQGVLDRFGQVEPKVFISADQYFYNGKAHDCLAKVEKIIRKLPSVQQLLLIPYLPDGLANKPEAIIDSQLSLTDLPTILHKYRDAAMQYQPMPFNAPLYIMYSSGTTGIPKCIVHGVGGTLLQHLKEHRLHVNLQPEDRIFYFTTCGWMMWNWLVSALASGATLMLYDGSPFYPNVTSLFEYAQTESISIFGTSAKYIDVLRKQQLDIASQFPLTKLHTLLSTGSVLVPEGFDYIYDNINKDLCVSSISGGTDIISCFLLGCPTLPVYRGELQCKGIGMQVETWNDKGEPVVGEKGELVCVKPFPSMPIYFWNDGNKAKYQSAYFERFDNIWCHGDYVEETANGGFIIYGRSDTVLNPGGVRIGTAEVYRQIEQLEEVIESIVIGQQWHDDVRIILFVKLQHDLTLDDALIAKVKSQIRQNTSPRHVPAEVIQVTDIPRTKSGKIVELAVKDVVEGHEVKNIESLANPEALAQFQNRVDNA